MQALNGTGEWKDGKFAVHRSGWLRLSAMCGGAKFILTLALVLWQIKDSYVSLSPIMFTFWAGVIVFSLIIKVHLLGHWVA